VTYSTLLAHLNLDEKNEGVLAVTASLARRLSAGVIGVAARQPVEMMYGSARMTGELIDLDRKQIKHALAEAEADLRGALAGQTVGLEWRGAATTQSLADHVAREARSADLVLTSPDVGVGFANSAVRMSVGDLVMRAGRPVLIVPDAARGLDLDHVLLAWKDTRESRRAVADALPLLALAGEVTVVEIAEKDDLGPARKRVEDVADWLGRHGIAAVAQAVEARRHSADRLQNVARRMQAGLVVAGAYGRVRLLEWAFGGVTCDLLMHPARCTLLSH
jgi:nucleotide-binding universal stress UspA family protein